ncbi:unnamed protein product [Lactuca saligna]|uniref:LRAT domain-containing protein n=1 Tax=Lactuca saligna TaxID=75948 RepID=A0AA35YDC3_LACSI|nr:unnamed protein product [Lactuca saligna]
MGKARGGTCTLAASDPPETTLHRTNYLLEHGFGCYNVFKNNCVDFALYCKTGLLVSDKKSTSQSGHTTSSFIGGSLMGVVSVLFKVAKTTSGVVSVQLCIMLVAIRMILV